MPSLQFLHAFFTPSVSATGIRRYLIRGRWLLLAPLLCWMALLQAAPVAIPALTARVTDLTQTLSRDQRAAMENQLAALEQHKGAQLAVLLIPSTGEESIEEYAVRAFAKWKLGRKGVDDGVLLVVAKDDRTLRIEVGYGLEGTITDASAGRIIRNQIVPHFREGDLAGGVQAGVDSLAGLIEGVSLLEPEPFKVPLDAWLILGAFLFGSCAGPILVSRVLDWRWLMGGAVAVWLIIAAFASSRDWWSTVPVSPLVMLVGGATFSALWMSGRRAFYIVLGIIVYIITMSFLANYLDSFVIIPAALLIPVGAGLLSLSWWLAISQVLQDWRKGRKTRSRLFLRVGFLMLLYALLCLFPRNWWQWLIVTAFMGVPASYVFLKGRPGSRSGSRGGSSSGGGFSGGGGSSGGGGASGRW